MEKLRKLFQICAKIKGFDGWVIGSMQFMAAKVNLPEPAAIAVKKKAWYAIVEMSSGKHCVRMHLFPWTSSGVGTVKIPIVQGCTLVVSKIFSKEEIQEFTQAVQDYNKIHQQEGLVVPGALIAEWLWENRKINFMDKVIVFRQVLSAQEKMEVYFDTRSQEYFAVKKEGGCLLWETKGAVL